MNMNATILGQPSRLFFRMVLHEVRMAAVNGCHRKTSERDFLTVWLLQNALKDLDLAQANATDQLKSESGSSGHHRAGEQASLSDAGRS